MRRRRRDDDDYGFWAKARIVLIVTIIVLAGNVWASSPSGIVFYPIAGLPFKITIPRFVITAANIPRQYIPVVKNQLKNNLLTIPDEMINVASNSGLINDDGGSEKTEPVKIDKEKVKEIDFGGYCIWSVYEDAADYYMNLPRYYDHEKDIQKYINDDYNAKFMKESVKTISTQLIEKGYSKSEMITFWISFVQRIPYEDDARTESYDDWPQYPIETIYKQSGDCEDRMILMLSILKTLGYDCAAFYMPDHAAVGLAGEGTEGTYIEYKKKKYLFIEPTRLSEVGELPEALDISEVTVIPISNN